MKRLVGVPELLDGPLDDPALLAANLRDLRRINRLFGGISLSRRALDALVGDRRQPVRLLDVGTGAVDIPVALQAEWRRRGQRLHVTAVDNRSELLEAAVALRPAIARLPDLALGIADGMALPYPDSSFDASHASLLVHHLDPDDAVALLRELGRVARLGVVVNDLVRSRLGWLGAVAVAATFARSAYTRYDAPLSVRRAYTRTELRDLLRRAGLRPVAEFRGVLGHRLAVAAVAAPPKRRE